MIILYGAGEGFGLPEISPYVTKTEVQLRVAGLRYRKERAAPNISPKGQLPFINDEGDLVGDSTFIRAHIERKYDIDLDEGLSPRRRAEGWAIERMLENHFGWVMAYTRWIMPENFSKGPARARRDHRARRPLAARAVGVARGSMLRDGRSPHWHRCYRLRDACGGDDAVLRLATARAGRRICESRHVRRSDDAAALSRPRLAFDARVSRVRGRGRLRRPTPRRAREQRRSPSPITP